MIIWLTGLSGAGKTTLARALQKAIPDSTVIDGDDLRALQPSGFDKQGRDANVMLAATLAKTSTRSTVICSLISPYRATRDKVRAMFDDFIEVFVDTPLEVCESRDAKGLYVKARRGEIANFTGISDPYEPPLNAEVVLQCGTVEEYVSTVIRAISAIPRGAQATLSKGSGA